MFAKFFISANIVQFRLSKVFKDKKLNNQVVTFTNGLFYNFIEIFCMITPPLILNCFEYKKRFDSGFSKPFLFAASDENDNEFEVVVKLRKPEFPNNNFGATSLACELICSIVLRLLGVSTPDYAIVSISESLANSLLIESNRKILMSNKGKNFGTIFQKAATTWYPNRQLELNESESNFIEDVMLFDSTVFNEDRKSDKPNILLIGQEKLLIDHSLAMPVHRWGNSDINNSPLFPETQIKTHCGFEPMHSKIKDSSHLYSFTKLLLNWENILNDENLKTIRDFIPTSWEENHGEIDKIFQFLRKRPEKFSDISESLRSIIQ